MDFRIRVGRWAGEVKPEQLAPFGLAELCATASPTSYCGALGTTISTEDVERLISHFDVMLTHCEGSMVSDFVLWLSPRGRGFKVRG